MDIWDKMKRSAVMARIKCKNTKPELIVLRKYRVAIFVHGCFWHGHEVDGHIPHSNTAF